MHMALKLITIYVTEVTYFGQIFYTKKYVACTYQLFSHRFYNQQLSIKISTGFILVTLEKIKHTQAKFRMVLANQALLCLRTNESGKRIIKWKKLNFCKL
jgi:hypothetical protein